MRVVSMVPSWTETLIQANVNVVGRTRYCIRPKDKLANIPIVGGTKNWNFKKIKELAPDYIILDKEENPEFMGEQSQIPNIVTHIESLIDVEQALKFIAQKINSQDLLNISSEWEKTIHTLEQRPLTFTLNHPGILEWGKKPEQKIKKIIYIIWKDPWMAVSKNTFIGSVLEISGFKNLLSDYKAKYPTLDLSSEFGLEVDKETTLLLFSSEPYPFLKRREGLMELGFPYAFVDGESFSWFGTRSLKFLKKMIV